MEDLSEGTSADSLVREKAQLLAEEWRTCNDAASLKAALYKYWRNQVPEVYQSNELAVPAEDDSCRDTLLAALEWYICNGDPDIVFQQLKKTDVPPQFCGRVFKMGEPTYSCRDCAMDPTCVLCIDCFQKSPHKAHRYRMNTSGGGGYCDCGDVEAWKSDPFCQLHQQGADQPAKDPLERLPINIQFYMSAVVSCILPYCSDILFLDDQEVLPENLRPRLADPQYNPKDTYATMLFNDEIHTYEQVIATLKKAVDCSPKEAVELATIVDREGRSTVRNGGYRECEQAKGIITRNTTYHRHKPLRVLVMHSAVVSHQTFSLKLLSWLIKIATQAEGLRVIICQELMKNFHGSDLTILEECMLKDTILWKAARIQWHQLFMSTLLMDNEYKKKFAVLFTKHYSGILSDFADDDHDHVVSVTSLSVQIFTVPTVSHMLIKEHSLLKVILKTFVDYTEKYRGADSKLHFQRASLLQGLRRFQYVLVDLRYVLSNNFEDWTAEAREKVMEGIDVLLELLVSMHGMDTVVRQVGQHIEFEPEWETAFNLQIKLGPCLTLLLEWCASDRSLLIRAYRATMKALRGVTHPQPEVAVEVAGHKATCFKFDVGTKHVTVHYALIRFLAGLHLHLGKYNLDYFKEGLLPLSPLTAMELIEEPLRTQVLMAQVYAGMWRRNGFSLLNQLYYYQNVRCQTEMFDKDTIMLQAGGAMMDPNEYLIAVLNRFDLVRYLTPEFAASSSTEDVQARASYATLLEEMLHLLIILTCERYMPGVGNVLDEDRIRREVIHQLCISPMAHSEITKALPEDHCHETGMEAVINKVADFKKPSGSASKGVYELKELCLADYSPFFYHYSRSDQSKAEEQQRKKKKQQEQELAAVPATPPALCSNFKPLVHLLDCDVFIYIVRTIVERTSNPKGKIWSENSIHRALYLIGLAVLEEERLQARGESFVFLDKAGEGEPSLLTEIQNLVGNSKVKAHKELMSWLIKKIAEVQEKKGEEVDMQAEAAEKELHESAKEEEERANRARMAMKRRQVLMDQMARMQKNFIKNNPEFFEETAEETPPPPPPPPKIERVPSTPDMEECDTSLTEFPIALGANPGDPVYDEPTHVTCILCQEEAAIASQGSAMVLAAFVQRSTVLSKNRDKKVENADDYNPLLMTSDLFWGTYTSTCGHVMHADCWRGYFESLLSREQRRALRIRNTLSYDLGKHQFLCPLCKTVSNTVVPLLPALDTIGKPDDDTMEEQPTQVSSIPPVSGSYASWLGLILQTTRRGMEIVNQYKAQVKEKKEEQEEKNKSSQPQRKSAKTESKSSPSKQEPFPSLDLEQVLSQLTTDQFKSFFATPQQEPTELFADGIRNMIRTFATATYTVGLDVMPDDDNERVPILAWNTCAYTIQVTEVLLRTQGKALFGGLSSRQIDGLRSVIRFATTSTCIANHSIIQQHALELLAALTGFNTGPDSISILDLDMFSLLVSLCLSLPRLYHSTEATAFNAVISSGAIYNLHILQMVLAAHIVQIMLTAQLPAAQDQAGSSDESMEQDEYNTDTQQLLKVYTELRQFVGLEDGGQPAAWLLWNHVQFSCLPFLRCAAIFFHFLTGVPSPAELQNVGLDEFVPLCRYLALPTNLAELFNLEIAPQMSDLVRAWGSHPDVKPKLTNSDAKILRFPLEVNPLVTLPDDYSDLMNNVSMFMCPKASGAQSDSRAPALCLVCGTVVCSQSYCCQTEIDKETVGACTAHAISCGAGVGIYLRVRECQLLLMSSKNRGCFYTPPYLDDYGEPDSGLRRGNPLHLSQEHYTKLHCLWLSHSIPAEVAHKLEANNNLLTIDWQNL
ncbi:E3 ubiquitin-protein ligase UBR2-like isoform X2 [Amphiura filiformis]|uniref:E3 ubiquitin-protein ligase UBR2-like isoform X2 n=1 Tax=Amphiura filiformis TaxID=82378 RepID=UPI003B20E860